MHSIKISVLKLSKPPSSSEAVSLTKQWRLNEDDLESRRKTALLYQMYVPDLSSSIWYGHYLLRLCLLL